MTISASHPSLIDQQHIVLDDVSWEFYEHLLQEVGDRPLRITYDQGTLEMMAPLNIHEFWKSRIGQLIELMCLERNIKAIPGGSTTFRRRDKEKGLEPDECYYVEHADSVRPNDDLDLTIDPPPDLAVEIDITSRSIHRGPIYAALGIPELWRFDGKCLTALHLDPDGHYSLQSQSDVFPFLPIDALNEVLLRLAREDSNAVLRAFRTWVTALP
jgi:Uma2 family endonuclease